MPIVLDPAVWPRERLLEQLRTHREDLAETLARLRDPILPVRDPASLRTAIDLVENVLALTDEVRGMAESSPALLAQVVNVQYDSQIAAIDLMKSHSDLPRVPRPRA